MISPEVVSVGTSAGTSTDSETGTSGVTESSANAVWKESAKFEDKKASKNRLEINFRNAYTHKFFLL